MARPKRELIKEHEDFIVTLNLTTDRGIRYYRKDLADMKSILDTSGHEVPDDSDYQELRKQRKNDTEFNSSKSRIEQYFQYKAETGRQINMFDNEATDNQGQDLAEVNSEATQPEADNDSTQEAQINTVNEAESKQPEINTANTHESNSNSINTKKRGRKKIYDDREKLTLYISKELARLIQCISTAKNISMSNYAVSILEQEIYKKKEMLEQILALQEQL